jgi:hypothetical protein
MRPYAHADPALPNWRSYCDATSIGVAFVLGVDAYCAAVR